MINAGCLFLTFAPFITHNLFVLSLRTVVTGSVGKEKNDGYVPGLLWEINSETQQISKFVWRRKDILLYTYV
jgi:hypothetical protein